MFQRILEDFNEIKRDTTNLPLVYSVITLCGIMKTDYESKIKVLNNIKKECEEIWRTQDDCK